MIPTLPQRNLAGVLPALKNYDRTVLILVDGLGFHQLQRYRAHAPFLAKHVADEPLSTVFPSTTAAALSSLGTGCSVGRHGIVGYDVLDPDRGVVINQLGGWDEATVPETWQREPTLFQQAVDAGRRVVTVSLQAFATSALTRASLAGGEFYGAKTIAERFRRAKKLLGANTLLYLYVNELDKAGHKYGPGSAQWLAVLEEIDAQVRRFVVDAEVRLTADHGMVEIPETGRIEYDKTPALTAHLTHTAGEPRFVHLYTQHVDRVKDAWEHHYGELAWVLSRDEAIEHGIFGQVAEHVRPRIGDVLVVPHQPVAFFDMRRQKPTALKMVGYHGSLTPEETEIPWLRL